MYMNIVHIYIYTLINIQYKSNQSLIPLLTLISDGLSSAVQNGIEVSKRQLIVVQWSEKHSSLLKKNGLNNLTKADFSAYIMTHGTPEIKEAWLECEQLQKAVIKNNGMKKNIAKRLRHNEKEAEKFREEMSQKITGEDRRELMALQYQVGRLELENMELEQHRIVHQSILKGPFNF